VLYLRLGEVGHAADMPTALPCRDIIDRLMRQQRDRCEPRTDVKLPVTFSLSANSVAKGRVIDLSPNGFRIRTSVVLYPGQRIRMQLPNAEASCELRWTTGFEAGGMFLKQGTK
jgi:hypothetical protein